MPRRMHERIRFPRCRRGGYEVIGGGQKLGRGVGPPQLVGSSACISGGTVCIGHATKAGAEGGTAGGAEECPGDPVSAVFVVLMLVSHSRGDLLRRRTVVMCPTAEYAVALSGVGGGRSVQPAMSSGSSATSLFCSTEASRQRSRKTARRAPSDRASTSTPDIESRAAASSGVVRRTVR